MGISTIFFILAAVAAGWEAARTRSFGWGGVCLLAVGLVFTTV